LQDLPKFTQNGIFGLKSDHLAALLIWTHSEFFTPNFSPLNALEPDLLLTHFSTN
jgi:hypothetical protein